MELEAGAEKRFKMLLNMFMTTFREGREIWRCGSNERSVAAMCLVPRLELLVYSMASQGLS